MQKTILPALVAGALAVAGCGGDDDGGVAGNGTDRAFVAAMVPHHESAVEMAEIARERGESAFVKDLASNIARTQKEEIPTMRREDEALDTAGVKPGSLDVPEHERGMDDDAAMLGDAKDFDRAFLEMMIPHHEGAVEMAKEESEKGKAPELRALAKDIVDAQEREIRDMRKHLGGDAGGEAEHDSGH